MQRFAVVIAAGFLIAAGRTKTTGPTKENALEAEKEIADAMRTNNADALCRRLDPDWAIITGIGGVGESQMGDSKVKEAVCAAVKSGDFVRTAYDVDLANARVRVYGDVATVTFTLSVSGALQHKTFSVKEVQTDVLKWQDGGWTSVLTHETNVRGTLVE